MAHSVTNVPVATVRIWGAQGFQQVCLKFRMNLEWQKDQIRRIKLYLTGERTLTIVFSQGTLTLSSECSMALAILWCTLNFVGFFLNLFIYFTFFFLIIGTISFNSG